MLRRLEHLSHEDRLGELEFFSLEKRIREIEAEGVRRREIGSSAWRRAIGLQGDLRAAKV